MIGENGSLWYLTLGQWALYTSDACYWTSDCSIFYRFLSFFPGILKTDYWQRLGAFQHKDIKKALTQLPDIIASSRQANTIRNYVGAYRRYELWAQNKEELSVYPANDLAITIYMLSLIQKGKSVATIHQFVFSVAWIHSVGGFPNPTKSPMVKTVLEGARRATTTTTTHKEPMTP